MSRPASGKCTVHLHIHVTNNPGVNDQPNGKQSPTVASNGEVDVQGVIVQ